MNDLSPVLILVLGLILWAEFVNGWTDAPNAIATVVSTRVLSPKKAIIVATILNIAGAFSGTAVAATIGKDIIRPEVVNISVIASAMIGIIAWSTLAWKWGLPTSESHALISGLAGAGLAGAGPNVLILGGWGKILLGLFFSTFLGFGGAYFLFVAIAWIFRNVGISRVRRIFGKLQIASA